jgi:hypothetical protein
MAVRIRAQFHAAGQPRSMAELASVVAVLAWKLAIDAIERMRQADYDIDVGRPYFDFVAEFTVFLAVAADRIAYRALDAAQRLEFTTALARRLASLVEENFGTLLEDMPPGEPTRHVLDLFNRRSADYAEFDYTPDGPDFGFKRYFAACLREGLPEKDRLWVVDQVMDIEVPEALKALDKTLSGLFHPDAGKSRRRPDGSGGASTGE